MTVVIGKTFITIIYPMSPLLVVIFWNIHYVAISAYYPFHYPFNQVIPVSPFPNLLHCAFWPRPRHLTFPCARRFFSTRRIRSMLTPEQACCRSAMRNGPGCRPMAVVTSSVFIRFALPFLLSLLFNVLFTAFPNNLEHSWFSQTRRVITNF